VPTRLVALALDTLASPIDTLLDSPAPGPFLAILIGFVLGIYGHAARLRWLVAIAIVTVFIGSIALFLAAAATEERPLPVLGG
jgi:hypothetical protein